MRPYLTLFAALTATVILARPAFTEDAPPVPELEPGDFGAGFGDYPDRAPIMLTVGPGSRAPDPVAVPDPTCRTETRYCDAVQETIARDLTLSGFFKVLNPDAFIADMSRETLSQTKWADWFNVGAKYLIKVDMEGAGTGNYSISYRLYDVNQHQQIEVKFQEASVSANGVRGATHKFVNEVIRAITGSAGPFGGKILFAAKTGIASKGIFSIGVDGFGRKALTNGNSIDMLPSMVNGNLLYTSFRPGRPQLYLNGKRITSSGRSFRGARLSPDGAVIAASADNGGQSDIFLVGTDGSIIKNLTKHWADEVSPTWSPDGQQIAFVSNRTGGPQIYLMNRDGSGMRRLTFAGGYNSTPHFGPNGLVVFAGMDEAHSDIFVVDMESNITRVTQDQGNNKDPSFSPDGRHIAFVSDREGKQKIFLSTVDGRYQFPITAKGGTYSTLFWAH